MAIRVVVAEDAFLVREAVSRLLAEAPGVEPVAAVSDSATLMATIEAERPDVVVTDIRMPPTDSDDGIRVAAAVRETHPDMGVVVLSQYAESAYVLSLLESGSARRAYLLKERVHHRGQLVDAVRAVHQGGSYIDPKIVELLVQGHSHQAESPLSALTPREHDVLQGLVRGHPNKTIAYDLGISPRTVEIHRANLMSKLGVISLSEALRIAFAAGLADEEAGAG